MREIFALGNSESRAGGWFRCSQCGFYIMLGGIEFRKAEIIEEQKKKIICSDCDPKNGLVPEIRRENFLMEPGYLYGGDGLG